MGGWLRAMPRVHPAAPAAS